MSIIKKLLGKRTVPVAPRVTVIPRDRHPISRNDISEHALKVLYRLHKSGYDAYLVGGCVRDLLLGVVPKDFDVVTNATPEQIRGLFKNCRLIGRRFRLAHIVFGREIIEVATFRGPHDGEEDAVGKARTSQKGMVLRDNVFGSIEEDAARRDFTVNALYYNIADFAIYDFVNGMEDLEAGVLKLIGDPEQRYREDPVRMLRAARFATKLSLKIDDSCRLPIPKLAYLLDDIPAARLFEESLKLFLGQRALANFEVLNELGLMSHLIPMLKVPLRDPRSIEYKMLAQVMRDTDARISADKSVNPGYLFAAMLWYPTVARAQEIMQEATLNEYDAYQIAAAEVTSIQARSISLPKRFSLPMRDIWLLQLRLLQQTPAKAKRLLGHPKFRAGFDFLLLRSKVENDPILQRLAEFWQQLQTEFPEQVNSSNHAPKAVKRRSGRRRNRGPRKNKPAQ
ncbi:MAG: poly(A) polymerase PcnB [Idiomarinaceae bacterium HL-53]|nr:MAG: poly(A) polymerase PcnB [Idiomarinaceae bacterium HL-53]CUS48242.1 poly(A) polymerase [Idiomarinaceae bacterium HL-53]